MDTFLIVFGFVAIAAAIVGGGMAASGVTIPVVSSIGRQVLLAALGFIVVLAGYDERNSSEAAATSGSTSAPTTDSQVASEDTNQQEDATAPAESSTDSDKAVTAAVDATTN